MFLLPSDSNSARLGSLSGRVTQIFFPMRIESLVVSLFCCYSFPLTRATSQMSTRRHPVNPLGSKYSSVPSFVYQQPNLSLIIRINDPSHHSSLILYIAALGPRTSKFIEAKVKGTKSKKFFNSVVS